jgi:protease-4
VLTGLLSAATGCKGRSTASATTSSDTHSAEKAGAADAKAGDVFEFDLSAGIRESPNAGFLFSLPASRTYVGLVRELDRAAQDPKARGFFIRLADASLDWAHSEELGLAFSRLREKSGKPIVCHAHGLDNRTSWFVARACTRVWVSPAGDVDTVGIGGQVVYVKGALDKLDVHADFLHMGKYKSAAETLTRDSASDEAKEALTAVLGSMRETWLEGVTNARKDRKDVAAALEDGPWTADAAKEQGLIDGVGYEDDARREAEELSHTHHLVVHFGGREKDSAGPDIAEILRLLSGNEAGSDRPHVAVVPASGSITMSGGGALSDSGITERAMGRVIRRLAADETVKAVVLRIDSPGGSALASDLIWHELMRLRKKKPLVVSVGDMAASGGYYLACAANKIYAERTSIVGSIGVVGGKIVLDEALRNFGVNAETFPASPKPGAGARAAYMSPLTGWDDATRSKVEAQMASVYELFLRRVAEGRGLPVELVRAVAEGRIWSGAQALRIRLVDEIGGLGKAIEAARQLGKLGADAPVRVEGAGETLLESLFVGDDADEATIRAAVAREEERRSRFLDRIEAAARPFVSAFEPLLEGETTVLALPFGLVVR